MFKHLLAPKLYKELNRANKKIRRHLYVTYLHTKNLFYRSQNTLDINKPIILIFSEYTATYPTTTGVQRVCKETAYQLKQLGAQVILVGLCCKSKQLRQLTNTECELFTSDTKIPKHFFKYQKQLTPRALKGTCNEQTSQGVQSWLMIPELTYLSRHNALTKQLFVLAKLLKLKTGVIFHDNIPLMTKKIDDWTHKHLEYATHLGDADIIWPNSEFSASSLAGFFQYFLRLEPQQTPLIETTLLAENIEGERGSVKKNISTHNILCVGTISHRKNQITLVKAFNRYCEQHPDTKWTLTIIGQVTSQLEKEFNKITSANPRINTQYNASYQTIKQAYNYCDFTVYPSILEGFGLPIVESLWHYRPVICANFGSMADIAAYGGCITLNTNDVNALTSAISTLIHDKKLYRCKVNEIENRQHRGWKDYVKDLINSMNSYEHNHCNGPTYQCNSTVQEFMNSHQALYDLFRPKLTISIINMSEISNSDLIAEQLASIMEQNNDIECIIGNIRNHTIKNSSKKTDVSKRIRIVNNPSKLNKKSFVHEIIATSSSHYVWITSKPNEISLKKVHSLIKSIDQQNSNNSNLQQNAGNKQIHDSQNDFTIPLPKKIALERAMKAKSQYRTDQLKYINNSASSIRET